MQLGPRPKFGRGGAEVHKFPHTCQILTRFTKLNLYLNFIYWVVLKIRRLHLKPGCYPVGLWLAHERKEVLDSIESAFEIEVTNEDYNLGSNILDDGVVTCDFNVHQHVVTGSSLEIN